MKDGERFNSITSYIGALAALAGMVLLIVFAALTGDGMKIISFSIYGVSLVLIYVFSSLYHSTHGKHKNFFKKLDHFAIYLLIAGTYTPFALVTFKGSLGWALFGFVWGLAVLGIIVDALPQKGHRILPMSIYLVMGWIVVVVMKPLLKVFPVQGFFLLLLGGIFYTGGIVFYALDKKVRHFHGVWHLFVLGGSICHYLTVYIYIL
jgi:hemolysin III